MVVVVHEVGEHGAQMPLVEHDEMVETFLAEGSNHSLRD